LKNHGCLPVWGCKLDIIGNTAGYYTASLHLRKGLYFTGKFYTSENIQAERADATRLLRYRQSHIKTAVYRNGHTFASHQKHYLEDYLEEYAQRYGLTLITPAKLHIIESATNTNK